MVQVRPDDTLDLRGVLCPMNFVQAKLKLEEMDAGQVLEVILDDGEPICNVPRSVKSEGHRIVKVEQVEGEESYRLWIVRGED